MTCDRCEATIRPRQRKCSGCEKSVKQIRIDRERNTPSLSLVSRRGTTQPYTPADQEAYLAAWEARLAARRPSCEACARLRRPRR